MANSVRTNRVSARRSSAQKQPEAVFLDAETQRQAKRLARQQKRLERENGLAQVIDINGNIGKRVVKLQDIKELEPLTDTQSDFFQSWAENDATGYVLFGSAGTGKTLLALYHGIVDVLDPEVTAIHKMIIVRSSVQSREQGHLPGDKNEKMEAFEAPYHSIFAFLTGKKDAYEKLKDMGKVEFVSTSFMRGDTFDNSIVVFDEAQNASWEELSTLITRVGKNSTLLICGDTKQNDLHFKKNDISGFPKFLEVSRTMPSFRNFRFTSDDIVRSAFVKEWIIACEKLGL